MCDGFAKQFLIVGWLMGDTWGWVCGCVGLRLVAVCCVRFGVSVCWVGHGGQMFWCVDFWGGEGAAVGLGAEDGGGQLGVCVGYGCVGGTVWEGDRECSCVSVHGV